MISWCIYFGTRIFGDSNFGVRFSGLVAMLAMQLLLADIVWRMTRDRRYYTVLAVLLPEAAIDYGLLTTKVIPDTPLIAFGTAMVWALVALSHLSGEQALVAVGGHIRRSRSAVESRCRSASSCNRCPLWFFHPGAQKAAF